jgi:hypothetical protein
VYQAINQGEQNSDYEELQFQKWLLFLMSFLLGVGEVEMNAPVSFPDHPLSVFSLFVNIYIFEFFCRTTGSIVTKLETKYSWGV